MAGIKGILGNENRGQHWFGALSSINAPINNREPEKDKKTALQQVSK